MMRNMNLRSIAVKIVTSAMVTVMIATGAIGGTIPTRYMEPIKIEAASDKFPAINSKIYQLIDKNTLDFNAITKKPNSNPLYSHLMANSKVTNVLDQRKDDFAKLAAGTFTDITGNEWYAHLIPLALYSNFTSGYPDGTFKGDQAVTKGEFAMFFASNTRTQDVIAASTGDRHVISRFGEKWWLKAYANVASFMPQSYGVKPSDNYGETTMCRGAVAYAIAKELFADEIADGGSGTYGKYYKQAISGNPTVYTDIKKINMATDEMTYIKNSKDNDLIGFFQAMEANIKNPDQGCPPQYYAAMLCLKDHGIMSGFPDGSSGWNQPVTRGQVLQFLRGANEYRGTRENG